MEKSGTTMHISKAVLLEKLTPKGYNSAQLSAILSKTPGSHSQFRSNFLGKKVHCIKIPRCHIDQDILDRIDSCKLLSYTM